MEAQVVDTSRPLAARCFATLFQFLAKVLMSLRIDARAGRLDYLEPGDKIFVEALPETPSKKSRE